jgi:protein-tyrosine phosphatase
MMMYKLLFLCTGNYYRSRFAEILFNTLASQVNLNWKADSRGIATDLGADNVGPISIHAIEGLSDRGIEVGQDVRFPRQLHESDLEQADLIIALKEAEHRPYLAQRFPQWVAKVEYWHIHDLDSATADEALPKIERELCSLIQRLSIVSQGEQYSVIRDNVYDSEIVNLCITDNFPLTSPHSTDDEREVAIHDQFFINC